MAILLDVVSVRATRDYMLYLEFENGEKKMFDMTSLMDKRPFVRLKGSPLFLAARVAYGTVCWPGNIDIAPETLYDLSVPLIEAESSIRLQPSDTHLPGFPETGAPKA
ncbi:DUF2442 domain-containing protein [Desulfatirhabdium butyrativorans]|uniref:DUF2442 domain-containing protein n=1 Tax=Desulfatirhabdium butyrativorans TaxID=340467 RepID=UPI000480826A|nr:DUF2442 domain-containing protein [Desulfatirhabdium butyrativorans]